MAFQITHLQAADRLAPKSLKLTKDSRIILIGNNLGSRMMNYGHFETEMQLRNPGKKPLHPQYVRWW